MKKVKWILLYLILSSTSSFCQPKNNSFNFSLGYSSLYKSPPKIFSFNGSGIRAALAYQYKFFQLEFDVNYNRLKYYDEQFETFQWKMEDKFINAGVNFNFRLINFKKHALYVGGHINKFHMLNHHYYYESFTSNELYEYNCSGVECPNIEGSSGYWKYDFEINLKWSLGAQLKYSFLLWKELYLDLIIDYSYARGIERYENTGTYFQGSALVMTPSLSFTYKIPFGEEYLKKSK